MNPFRLNDAGGLDFLDRDRHLQRLRNLAGIEQARRPEKRYPARVNPADMMTDAQFKMHFRVDKETALTLVDLLGLTRPNVDWGSPSSGIVLDTQPFCRRSLSESDWILR